MVRQLAVGAPLPFGDSPAPAELLVAEAGSYARNDGIRVVLSGENLVFLGAFDGTQLQLGIAISDLLGAIAQFTQEHES